MATWVYIQPNGDGDYELVAGGRYAALVSVSRDYTLAEVAAKASSRGIQLTYAWEEGQPNRDTYAIDAWLAKQPKDPNATHRFVYAEADVTADQTIGANSPWPLTIYSVKYFWRADRTKDAPPAPPPPGGPQRPKGTPWLLFGGLFAGGVGLGYWLFGGRRETPPKAP